MYPSVQDSTIYDNQDLEITWMSTNRWKEEEVV